MISRVRTDRVQQVPAVVPTNGFGDVQSLVNGDSKESRERVSLIDIMEGVVEVSVPGNCETRERKERKRSSTGDRMGGQNRLVRFKTD